MTALITEQDPENKDFKKWPLCPKCKVKLGPRVHRPLLFKTLLGFLPLKRYYCYQCKQKKYVWN